MAAEWVAATINAFNRSSILREHQVHPRDAEGKQQCSYFLILHTAVARDMGLNRAKVPHLASWRDSTMFAEDEGAALPYTEALTVFDLSTFAEHHERLARFFDEKSVAEIAAVAINLNDWTTLKLPQRQCQCRTK